MAVGIGEAEGESVVVVGAGIAGLCTALRLGAGRRRVTLLERDQPPPEGGPDAAFERWQRSGVGQLRQSHAFLARLRNILRDEHPALLADLHAAGCRDIAFADMLPPALRARYEPRAEDGDLTILTSRRTTLELVIWACPLLIIVALSSVTWTSTHLLDPFRPLERISPAARCPPAPSRSRSRLSRSIGSGCSSIPSRASPR